MPEEKRKKQLDKVGDRVADIWGNQQSAAAQKATDAAVKGMDDLLWKAARLRNVGFDQAKGNLFEYIEAAKLSSNIARKGAQALDKSPLTDLSSSRGGFGENTAPDDFRIVRKGRIRSRGQAKYNNDPHRAAVNFTNPKYANMQYIAPIDQVEKIREKLIEMLDKGEISKDCFEGALNGLQSYGLTDPETGISSGGTTTAEINSLIGKDGRIDQAKVKAYAHKFELRHMTGEAIATASYVAQSNAIVTGVLSGVRNLYCVLEDKKEFRKALKDIGVDVSQSAVRGGSVGALSSILRNVGKKNQIPIISDSSSSIAIAGSILDCGVAILAYAKGEISANELKDELLDTTVKSVSTLYFTKALAAIGRSSTFMPAAIYTVASVVVSCTREVINNAKLNAEEHRRVTALMDESTKSMREYRVQLNRYISEYEQSQREMLNGFIEDFQYNVSTGENYESAVFSIVRFANTAGIVLRHTDFDEFCSEMQCSEKLVLK